MRKHDNKVHIFHRILTTKSKDQILNILSVCQYLFKIYQDLVEFSLFLFAGLGLQGGREVP